MQTVVIDFEATGLEPETARIIQLAMIRNGDEPLVGYVNPECPIPAEVSELTGIHDSTVAAAEKFSVWAPKIADYLLGCDAIVGFGCLRYDVPLLGYEFDRAGVRFDWSRIEIIDAGNIYKKMEGRTLSDAVRFYCGREHSGAHDALVDVLETRSVLESQLERYDVLKGKSLAELAAISRYDGPKIADMPYGKLAWIDGRLCFNTQRNKGVPVANEVGYAHWMMNKDFPRITLELLEQEMDRINTERQVAADFAESVDSLPY